MTYLVHVTDSHQHTGQKQTESSVSSRGACAVKVENIQENKVNKD